MTPTAAPRPMPRPVTGRRSPATGHLAVGPAERVHAVLLAAEIRASGAAALFAHALAPAAAGLVRG